MKVKINKQFKMSAEDIAILKALPDNLPESILTKKQKDEVKRIYRKYIYTNNDGYGGNTLYKLEKGENWPSGHRVKDHEGKRMLLNTLMEYNKHGDLTLTEAVRHLQSALTWRKGHAKLFQLMYERI